jgi:8-hydroxy-5-deazaflavin:NADPH oxidoreductase
MRIGIIGAGAVGGTLARLWTNAGHEIAIANSRGPDSLAELAASIGPLVHAMTVDEVAAFGEVVVLAAPFRKPEALPRPDLVKGKIVVDAMNPYAEGGEVLDLGGRTSSVVTAERLPGARVVKAFNTIHRDTLASAGRPYVPEEQRLVVFLAGDDARAKDRVAQLIREIGFAPVDTGSLAIGGRLQEPGSKIFDRALLPSEARQTLARM